LKIVGRFQEGCYANDDRGPKGQLVSPNEQKFSRKGIGEREYAKVMATLSRSVLRLEASGLVEWVGGRNWSGVEITEAGRTWLSVNSAETFRRINR
jgi:hypothetical protein